MQGDFEKLVTHATFKTALIDLLIARFHKYADRPRITGIIDSVAKKKTSTADALAKLRDIYVTESAKDSVGDAATMAAYNEARVAARVRDLRAFSGYISAVRIRNYLDIGCGNGVITAGIGALLGLEKDAIIGADIATWAGHSHAAETSAAITFKSVDSAGGSGYHIDLPDGGADLITIFMVLHHIKDDVLPAAMAEVRRILAPDGLVIIREHDSPNEYVDRLINIEHALFETIIEGLVPVTEFQAQYFGRYKPKRDWVALFEAYGFQPLGSPMPAPGGTRLFYQAFRRRTGATTIETKTAPELLAETRRLGIAVPKGSASTDALKRAIIAGRRQT